MDFPNQCGAAVVRDKTNNRKPEICFPYCVMFLYIYHLHCVCKHRGWANVIKVKTVTLLCFLVKKILILKVWLLEKAVSFSVLGNFLVQLSNAFSVSKRKHFALIPYVISHYDTIQPTLAVWCWASSNTFSAAHGSTYQHCPLLVLQSLT